MLTTVNFECAGDVEALTTKLTLEWLLTTVVAHMNFEVAFLCELGAADVALEGFDPQVALLVPHQVVFLCEGSWAQVAGEGLLPSMLPCVCLQTGDVQKHPTTHITLVLVCLHKIKQAFECTAGAKTVCVCDFAPHT